MATEAEKAASKKYRKKCRSFLIMLNRDNDGEIISMLESMPNKTDYIRKLIESDLEGSRRTNRR